MYLNLILAITESLLVLAPYKKFTYEQPKGCQDTLGYS